MTPLPTGPLRELLARAGNLTVRGERLSDAAQAAAGRGLEEMMQTPARRVLLDLLFREFARRVAARTDRATAALVRCRVCDRRDGDAAVYELHLQKNACRVVRGSSDRKPELTVTLDDHELIRLALGRSTPARAVLRGKLRLSGDVPGLAALLLSSRP
jgi:alkyl sulfatase BDS1-like metallo-beta-lactamase superfamily hydrolase